MSGRMKFAAQHIDKQLYGKNAELNASGRGAQQTYILYSFALLNKNLLHFR
jgi:hypothetical protein